MLPLFGPFFGLGIGLSLLLLFIALLAAVLGQLAIGRAGEYAADECGARLSGRRAALAAALRLASTDDAEFDDVANSQVAIALLAIGKRLAGPRRDNSFSAYPLPTNRIAALDQLSREMGSGGHGAVCNEPTRGELLRLLPGFRSRIDRNKRFDAVTA